MSLEGPRRQKPKEFVANPGRARIYVDGRRLMKRRVPALAAG